MSTVETPRQPSPAPKLAPKTPKSRISLRTSAFRVIRRLGQLHRTRNPGFGSVSWPNGLQTKPSDPTPCWWPPTRTADGRRRSWSSNFTGRSAVVQCSDRLHTSNRKTKCPRVQNARNWCPAHQSISLMSTGEDGDIVRPYEKAAEPATARQAAVASGMKAGELAVP